MRVHADLRRRPDPRPRFSCPGRSLGPDRKSPQLAKAAPRCLHSSANGWADAEVSGDACRAAGFTKPEPCHALAGVAARLLLFDLPTAGAAVSGWVPGWRRKSRARRTRRAGSTRPKAQRQQDRDPVIPIDLKVRRTFVFSLTWSQANGLTTTAVRYTGGPVPAASACIHRDSRPPHHDRHPLCPRLAVPARRGTASSNYLRNHERTRPTHEAYDRCSENAWYDSPSLWGLLTRVAPTARQLVGAPQETPSSAASKTERALRASVGGPSASVPR